MLYNLFQNLVSVNSAFNAFTYLSSRTILAMITAILISMVSYRPLILWLRAIKLGQPIREVGPAHFEKKGTPTMGGVVIIISTVISALLWMDIKNPNFVTLVFVTVTFGFVGFLDDYLKVSKKNSKGLASRYKMLGILVFGAMTVAWHWWASQKFGNGKVFEHVNIPFVKEHIIDLGYFYFPFAVFVLAGTSNAVNLTDGLDGLAIGPVITCSMAFIALTYVTGNVVLAKYLNYHVISGSGEITIYLAALIGGSIGFLWYNTWPAQIFMGDSGALPLGGILGTVAVITGHEILLVLMGGVFVVEALSVIIQVTSFKMFGRRVFKMAPVHHHFEKIGWPEQKITVRAWIISLMLALFSILTLKLR